MNKRSQYSVEKLFKQRQAKFREYPGVLPELDLIEDEDRITHEVSLDDPDVGAKAHTQDQCNVFQFDPEYD